MMLKLIRSLWRSAITGRFISRKDAEQHPETSVKERSPRKGRKSAQGAPV
jgi:hypothetical protein